MHQKEIILHAFCFSDFQELYKRKNRKILQWKCLKGHNGLSKARRVGPVKGNMSPAKVETRENKRKKKLSRESLLLPLLLLLLLPPSLLILLSLRVNNLFLTGSFSRTNVVIESRNGSLDLF